MTDAALPFAEEKFIEIKGHRMAYIDEGEGAPIVFQHGNRTSSYLWRNVMPACRGLGRLIACDLIGLGDSAELPNSGLNRYTYAEHRSFLFALWEELKLRNEIIFAVHDGVPRSPSIGRISIVPAFRASLIWKPLPYHWCGVTSRNSLWRRSEAFVLRPVKTWFCATTFSSSGCCLAR
jgi:hypothetical protein